MAKTIAEWDEQYRTSERAKDLDAAPSPLVLETVRHLSPGRALNLACGMGRNALWLAEAGWTTVALDGSEVAITALRSKATQLGLKIDARVTDLTAPEFTLQEDTWDLILKCYFLQRILFPQLKKAIVSGGIATVIVHIAEPGGGPTATRLLPGELAQYFAGWSILHSYERNAREQAHRRPVAEIVAQRPIGAVSEHRDCRGLDRGCNRTP